MTEADYNEYQDWMFRLNAGGNDLADIHEFEVFVDYLVMTYNKPIETLIEEYRNGLNPRTAETESTQ